MQRLSALVLLALIPASIHAQTRKTPAPIVDGPAYTASQTQPAAPATKADNPICLEAMQVIGHNAEALFAMSNDLGAVRSMDDIQAALQIATVADSLLSTAKTVTGNDLAYCQTVIKTIPRIYPEYRDKQDHMSTGRIMLDLSALRVTASTKAQLESDASRDISH
jgi:hypothetical protein